MSELSRKDNLKIFIESRTTQINEGVPLDRKAVLEQEIAVFQKEYDEILNDEQEQAEQLEVVKAQRVFTVNGEELTLDEDTAELFGILLDSEIPKINEKHNQTVAKIRETFRQQAEETAYTVMQDTGLLIHQHQVELDDLYKKIGNAEDIAKEAVEKQRIAEEKVIEEERKAINAENKVKQKDIEIDQLKQQIESLKNQVTPTEITAQGNRAKELVEKIRLKNIDYLDFKRSKLGGTDAEGNLVEFGFLDKEKYESIQDWELPPSITFQEVTEPVEAEGKDLDLFQGSMADLVQGTEQEGTGEDNTNYRPTLPNYDETAKERRIAQIPFDGEERRTVNENVKDTPPDESLPVSWSQFIQITNAIRQEQDSTIMELNEIKDRILALENSPMVLKESA